MTSTVRSSLVHSTLDNAPDDIKTANVTSEIANLSNVKVLQKLDLYSMSEMLILVIFNSNLDDLMNFIPSYLCPTEC